MTRAVKKRLERSAAEIARDWRLGQIEQRRDQIDLLDRVADAASRPRASGLLDQERHVDRFLVHEQPVFLLAVIPQPFTVIRQQHDGGAVVELVRLEIPDQTADDFVRVRNFAVVRGVLGESGGRGVWLVRLVEVQEEEHTGGADGVEPVLGDDYRVGAVALHLAGRPLGRARGHLVVEELEPPIDAGVLAQHVRRDDAAGGVAAFAQHLRQQPLTGSDREPEGVAHARLEGQPSRQQRGVRGQRLRRVRVRALEHDTVLRQPVNGGRAHLLVSVRRQMVGPQRVDGDDDDRTVDRCRRARVAPAADRREAGTKCGEDQNEREPECSPWGRRVHERETDQVQGSEPRTKPRTQNREPRTSEPVNYFFSWSIIACDWAASGEIGSTAMTFSKY